MVTFSYQAICFVSQTFGLCLGWSSSSRSSSRSSYNTKWISFRLFCAFLMSPRTLLIIYHIILLISLSFLCCRSCWYGYFDIWFWNVLRIRFECWPSNLVLVYWTYKLSTRFHIYVIVFYLDGKGGGRFASTSPDTTSSVIPLLISEGFSGKGLSSLLSSFSRVISSLYHDVPVLELTTAFESLCTKLGTSIIPYIWGWLGNPYAILLLQLLLSPWNFFIMSMIAGLCFPFSYTSITSANAGQSFFIIL